VKENVQVATCHFLWLSIEGKSQRKALTIEPRLYGRPKKGANKKKDKRKIKNGEKRLIGNWRSLEIRGKSPRVIMLG